MSEAKVWNRIQVGVNTWMIVEEIMADGNGMAL